MLRSFLILIFIYSSSLFALKKPAFSLKDSLKTPLTSLLDIGVYFHEAVYSQNEGKIRLALSKLENQIEILERSPQFLPYHQRTYVYRLLQNLKPHLDAVKISSKERKRKIKAINRILTHMAHIYGLKKYAVFFCPKDRSVWMQGEKKSKPLHLEYSSCGAWVGR